MRAAILLCVMLASSYRAYADTGCLAEGCHRRMLAPKFVHGPVAVGDCGYCHARTGEHSFKPAGVGAGLCASCHEFKNARADCTACHDPHGTDREFQLKPNVKGKCKK